MDEIKQRLHDTSEQCYKCYEAWLGNKKDAAVRENLRESVHELRKVASRLEIELAVSENSQGGQSKIAIPPHRDAKNRSNNNNDSAGNKAEENPTKKAPPKKGKLSVKKEDDS
ncbi:MAG: hypothetical protein KDJ35_01835 [Alphaproteobacteria bacterium]|nr:hypothetical protein [Alphaproteobacteria bacterium]